MNRKSPQLINIHDYPLVEEEIALSLAKAWHAEFLPNHKKWLDKKPRGSFRWEQVLCHSDKEDAQKDFESHFARTYFIMPEDFGKDNFIMYKTDEKPQINAFEQLIDCYIFPKNLAWSMNFTHESGWIGPYFSKHSNYEKLNKKNMESINARRYQ